MNTNKIYRYLFLIVVTCMSFLLPQSLWGDDTLVGGNGYTAFPINTDKITMLSEHVTISMGTYNSSESVVPLRRAFVRCIFVFRNMSNKEIKATVGFPTSIYDGFAGLVLPNLNDFSSYIGGHSAKVKIRKEVISKKPLYAVKGSLGTVETYRYWYTWNVTFPPLKRVIIKNSYWVTLSSGWGTNWLEYILTTGANWKGNIGKAVIEVIYPSARDLRERVIYDKVEPEGYMTYGNKIYWEFKNFKPKTNIRITEKEHVNELNIR